MNPINSICNVVKVGAIWLADLINKVGDPYEDFTRAEDVKYFERLNEKAAKFEKDLADFWWPERSVYLYTLPGNSGDQCLWHGVYTSMWALKYSVTDDQDALNKLKACVFGLDQHQHPIVSGPPRLIRGWRTDGTFEDSVSNDQITGHVLGIYFLWKYGDIWCREQAKRLIIGLADELAINDNKLINADGSPTQYGKLENGYLTDPLNLTLCLAIYRVAFEIAGEQMYLARYNMLVDKYRLIIPYANVRLLWWEKTHHAHRAAIHYSILCDLERDHDIHRKYLAGLLRTWRMEKESRNPWIYYLVRRVCNVDPAMLEEARILLKEFTLEDKQYNVERINSTRVPTFKWGKHLRARQPQPRWRIGSQDFFWQRHMYSVDDWIGNKTGDVRHNGGDFLVAYWGLRNLRLITVTE